MRGLRFRSAAAIGAAAALLLLGTACDPIQNAPPGGGAITEQTFRIGPFNLAPEGQPGFESNTAQSNVPKPSGAFGMKSISFDLVDAAGNSLPHTAVHLHHVLLMNPAHQDAFCSRSERFAGSGSERTPMSLPDPYAYMVGSGERWNALWHIMNESTTAQTVYIQYKVGYQTGATAQNTRGVTPFFLDVTGCNAGSIYQVPGNGGPGSVHTNTRSWTIPWSGYHVGAGGHLHGGGINITLGNDTTGDQCTMTAHYEHSHPEGAPGSIDRCPFHKHFSQGDTVRVTSRYDNSMPHEDVMGIVLAYAWQGSQ
jgi:hypothetical protein